MTDLIDRLREAATICSKNAPDLCAEAVARIRELEAERDALREALTIIAARECENEDECAELALRRLRRLVRLLVVAYPRGWAEVFLALADQEAF